MNSFVTQRFGSRLLSLTSHLLVCFVLFTAMITARASGLPATESDPAPMDLKDICTANQINEALNSVQQGVNKTGEAQSDLAQLLFEHCTADFLVKNEISPKVKQVIDEWMGLDVSKAKSNQLYWLNLLSLQSPKPQDVGDKFESDCKSMNQAYEAFRMAIQSLADKIDIQISEGNDLKDDQQDLLGYTLYARFCSAIVESQV